VARKTKSAAKAKQVQGDGVAAELFDRILENPANSGGLMVVALTATAIVSNAMFLQNGHHPGPLFSTRPSVASREVAKPAVPRPNLAPVQAPAAEPEPASAAVQPLVVVPLPHPSPRRAAFQPAPAQQQVSVPSAADVEAQITTDVQRELARLGLYSGAIDGKPGPRTSAAVAAYERAAGLQVTGQASAALLQAMKQPLPKPQAAVPVPTAPGADPIAAALDQREQQRANSIAAQQETQAEQQMHQNYRIVQTALNRMGYASLPIDGNASAATSDAIRRFELDNGLPITGEASDDLIARMIAIGAIKPI
jgi:peptidoglycan hydrolase-like protein with peptidoglycan-binding domain